MNRFGFALRIAATVVLLLGLVILKTGWNSGWNYWFSPAEGPVALVLHTTYLSQPYSTLVAVILIFVIGIIWVPVLRRRASM